MAAIPSSQALVTDPTTLQTDRGYRLVARSNGVTDSEAEFLERHPEVTDELHGDASLGVQLSFLPLPSGRFALTRRFVSGMRRSGHRIVVHSLLFRDALLEALDGEPWLLTTQCTFQMRDGATESEPVALERLGELALATSGERLPELRCLTPDDPAAASASLARERLERIRKTELAAALGDWMDWAVGHLASGRRLLLPSHPAYVDLAALLWSALPLEDRRTCPWSTHLAPSTSHLLRIAHAPEPDAALRLCRSVAEWALLDDPPPATPALPLAAALGTTLARGDLRTLRRIRAASGGSSDAGALSLLRNPATLQRWLAWSELAAAPDARTRPFEHFETLLAGSVRERAGLDPWVDRKVVLAAACRATVDASTLATVLRLLERAGGIEALGDLESFAVEAGVETPALGLGYLLLMRAASYPEGADRFESAWTWVLARWTLDALASGLDGSGLHGSGQAALVDVVLDRLSAPRESAAREWLARDPERLAVALEQVAVERDLAESGAAWVIERALDAAGPLRARTLEILGSRTPALTQLPPALRERVIAEVADDATWLPIALQTWPAEIARRIADAWKARLAVGSAGALAAARQLVGAARPVSAPVRALLLGVTRSLAGSTPRAPQELWLPYALLESAERDAQRQEPARWIELLGTLKVATLEPAQARALRQTLRTAARELRCGGNLAALWRAVGAAAASNDEVATLDAVFRMRELPLDDWGCAVEALTEQLARARESSARASTLRRLWAVALAEQPWQHIPRGLVEAMEGASERDFQAIASAWSRKLSQGASDGRLRPLEEILTRRARGASKRSVDLALIEQRHGERRMPLETALRELSALACPPSERKEATLRMLDREPEPARRALALLLDREIPPSIQLVLEQHVIRPRVGSASLPWPAVHELAVRPALLLLAAKDFAASVSREGLHGDAIAFSCDALEGGHLDALAALARGIRRDTLRRSWWAEVAGRQRPAVLAELERDPRQRAWLDRAREPRRRTPAQRGRRR